MGGTSLKNSANGHERCFLSRQTKNRLCALAYYDIVVTYWAANGCYLRLCLYRGTILYFDNLVRMISVIDGSPRGYDFAITVERFENT